MARARSPEKRQAIFASAVREIALGGLGASTAKIAAGANVAEGTLFTYFPSKEELFNELYLALKTEVFQSIQQAFPWEGPLRERTHHLWTAHLTWALAHPDKRKVSVLLSLSPVIRPECRARVDMQGGVVAQTLEELGRQGSLAVLPRGFASRAMLAMQEAVMEMAPKHPGRRAKLVEEAFDAFWRMAS